MSASTPEHTDTSSSSAPSRPRPLSLLLNGLALIALFFVPDVMGTATIFPIQEIAVSAGADLVALLIPALVGALTVAIARLAPTVRGRQTAGILNALGAVAMAFPENNHLPISGPFAALLVIGGIAVGLVSRRSVNHPLPTEIIIWLLPVSALLFVVAGWVTGAHSPAYLVSVKTPIEILLLMRTAVSVLIAPKK